MDAPKTIPAPGIYYDVPAETYFAWDCVNASFLKKMNDCPRQAKWEIDNPKSPTPAMVKGSLVHCLTLEPDKVHQRYITGGECCAILKSGKNAGGACGNDGVVLSEGGWYCGRHCQGRTPDALPTVLSDDGETLVQAVIKSGMMEDAQAMAISLRSDRFARRIIEETKHEVSIVWVDPVTGVMCKARMDAFSEDPPMIGDIKTASDPSPLGFAKAIADNDYHIQAAFYLDGAMAVCGGVEHDAFYFLAVKNEGAYTAACYKAHQGLVKLGRDRYRRLLEDVKLCKQEGYWPGYHDHRCEPIGVPHWFFEQEAHK